MNILSLGMMTPWQLSQLPKQQEQIPMSNKTDNIPRLNFEDFTDRYCERQVSTRAALRATFDRQKRELKPDGWMMLECQVLDSSRMGSLVILPYGGQSTYKEIPDYPVSPRGLASDMSVVVAILPVSVVN